MLCPVYEKLIEKYINTKLLAMKSKLFTCLMTLFAVIPLMAQTRSVSGTVTSSSDGLPLPGVVVTVESNISLYAITDVVDILSLLSGTMMCSSSL